MMKHLFLSFLVFGLFVGGVALAQSETDLSEVDQAETVTLEDLEVLDPGILPTSPFYFFKEWGRGVQSFFTFNSVAKVELEAKFANEKAAELKVVEEQRPSDETGIARALLNFERAQKKVALRLERLQETSDNPNVDRLLEKLTEKSILHEKLLQEVAMRHQDKERVRVGVKEAGLTIANVIGRAAEKEDPEKFAQRLKRKLEATRGSELKDIRAVEILDRIGEKVSEDVRERLEGVREGLKERAKVRLEELAEKGEDRIHEILKRIPGDESRRAVVLEELRLKISDRASGALRKAQDAVEERILDAPDRMEKAAEQIKRAGERIEKAQQKLKETDEIREAVKTLLEQAERHLVSAKEAFEGEKYGEAFGQARAAEVSARNALRALEGGNDAPSAIELKRVQDRVQDRVRLSEPTTSRPRRDDAGDAVLCTLEYAPVCGTDGKTYSNRCHAENRGGVKVAYRGECRDSALNCLVRDPVCGVDGKTYVCGEEDAKLAGVEVVHKGECKEGERDQNGENDTTDSRLRLDAIDILQKLNPLRAPSPADGLKSAE